MINTCPQAGCTSPSTTSSDHFLAGCSKESGNLSPTPLYYDMPGDPIISARWIEKPNGFPRATRVTTQTPKEGPTRRWEAGLPRAESRSASTAAFLATMPAFSSLAAPISHNSPIRPAHARARSDLLDHLPGAQPSYPSPRPFLTHRHTPSSLNRTGDDSHKTPYADSSDSEAEWKMRVPPRPMPHRRRVSQQRRAPHETKPEPPSELIFSSGFEEILDREVKKATKCLELKAAMEAVFEEEFIDDTDDSAYGPKSELAVTRAPVKDNRQEGFESMEATLPVSQSQTWSSQSSSSIIDSAILEAAAEEGSLEEDQQLQLLLQISVGASQPVGGVFAAVPLAETPPSPVPSMMDSADLPEGSHSGSTHVATMTSASNTARSVRDSTVALKPQLTFPPSWPIGLAPIPVPSDEEREEEEAASTSDAQNDGGLLSSSLVQSLSESASSERPAALDTQSIHTECGVLSRSGFTASTDSYLENSLPSTPVRGQPFRDGSFAFELRTPSSPSVLRPSLRQPSTLRNPSTPHRARTARVSFSGSGIPTLPPTPTSLKKPIHDVESWRAAVEASLAGHEPVHHAEEASFKPNLQPEFGISLPRIAALEPGDVLLPKSDIATELAADASPRPSSSLFPDMLWRKDSLDSDEIEAEIQAWHDADPRPKLVSISLPTFTFGEPAISSMHVTLENTEDTRPVAFALVFRDDAVAALIYSTPNYGILRRNQPVDIKFKLTGVDQAAFAACGYLMCCDVVLMRLEPETEDEAVTRRYYQGSPKPGGHAFDKLFVPRQFDKSRVQAIRALLPCPSFAHFPPIYTPVEGEKRFPSSAYVVSRIGKEKNVYRAFPQLTNAFLPSLFAADARDTSVRKIEAARIARMQETCRQLHGLIACLGRPMRHRLGRHWRPRVPCIPQASPPVTRGPSVVSPYARIAFRLLLLLVCVGLVLYHGYFSGSYVLGFVSRRAGTRPGRYSYQ